MGEERNSKFSKFLSLQQKQNVYQTDVPITKKTNKAQDALLADLLARHAAC